jgi:hypothetical protein
MKLSSIGTATKLFLDPVDLACGRRYTKSGGIFNYVNP